VRPTRLAARFFTPLLHSGQIALAVIVVAATIARAQNAAADIGDEADAQFRHATANGSLAEFLAIADEHPASIWADNALAEAARLVEKAGDRARAAALLERLVVTYPQSPLVRWARAHAAELAGDSVGAAWTEIAAAHDAVVAAAGKPGDPTPHLEVLEALLRAHPDYPRGHAARLWLGDAWGREGDWSRGLRWYHDAGARAQTAEQRRAAHLRATEALVALADFAGAESELASAARDPEVDPIAIARMRGEIEQGRARWLLRIAAWIALALLALAGALLIVRATGSARAALRALARPPIELAFYLPCAAVVVAMSAGGNPLIATAVRRVAIGGALLAWFSAVVLRALPPRRRIHAALHLAAIAVAGLAVVYLSVSTDRLVDILLETWRTGPERR
jgi:hypothetical protein